MKIKLTVLTFLLLFPFSSFAVDSKAPVDSGPRQFTSSISLHDGTALNLTLVASASEESHAQSTMSAALSRILALDNEIFGAGGVQATLNSQPSGTPVKLSPDAFAFIDKALLLSAQTTGWFDITAAAAGSSLSSKDWHKVKLVKSDSTILLKSNGMSVDFGRICKGFYADLAIDNAKREGFTNAMAGTGIIQRNIGRDIYTPWCVDVNVGNEGAQYANRMSSFKVSNAAAATVTPDGLGKDLIDGRSRKVVDHNSLKSVTVFASDASTATAYAIATYTVGVKYAMKFIERHREIKGIVVDSTGRMTSSTGLIGSGTGLGDNWPATSIGGPEDIRQKKNEEANEM